MITRLHTCLLQCLVLLMVVPAGSRPLPANKHRSALSTTALSVALSTPRSIIPEDSPYRSYLEIVTIDALQEYLTSKKNLSDKSPFKQIIAGKGDILDFLRGISLVKRVYDINPLFALAFSALESKWGKSRIAKDYHNLWGFNAVDSNPERATRFESFTHGFEHVFRFIKFKYLHKDGTFYKRCNHQRNSVVMCVVVVVVTSIVVQV